MQADDGMAILSNAILPNGHSDYSLNGNAFCTYKIQDVMACPKGRAGKRAGLVRLVPLDAAAWPAEPAESARHAQTRYNSGLLFAESGPLFPGKSGRTP